MSPTLFFKELNFASTSFLFFFGVIVLPLRWLLPDRAKRPWLLLASIFFYASWSIQNAAVFAVLTVTCYAAGNVVVRATGRRRTLVMGAAVASLIGILAYYKYSNFILSNLAPESTIKVEPPLGISFFTFEMICYLIDIHRGGLAAKSLFEFSVYMSYFPHLVAGPIVRSTELLPQLRAKTEVDGELLSEGMFLAMGGLLKKVVLADNLATFADRVFASSEPLSTATAWVGVLAYTGQIYCDFSGYTDMARGASLMLGFRLPQNFDSPYLSRSITEFWRRWHITLSRWLRDYLYISLGGNRGGKLATYRNLMITMLLGGLWHGARWTFLAWGLFHGALLALHKLYLDATASSPALTRLRANPVYQALALLCTLVLVMTGWVFFRAVTFDSAAHVLGSMFRWRPMAGDLALDQKRALFYIVSVAVMHVLGAGRRGEAVLRRLPAPLQGLLWAGIVVICYILATSSPLFIYFNF